MIIKSIVKQETDEKIGSISDKLQKLTENVKISESTI